MKIFKRLATVLMALTLCFGFAGALTACDDEGGAGSSSEQPANNAYVFTVVDKDGAPVKDAIIQLCIPNGSCLMAMPTTDANGKATFEAPEAAVYDIHVWAAGMTQEYTLTGVTQTPATYGAVTVTIG